MKTRRLKSIVKVKAKRYDNIMSYIENHKMLFKLEGNDLAEELQMAKEMSFRAFERIHNKP